MQVTGDSKSLHVGDRIYEHVVRFSSEYDVLIFIKLMSMSLRWETIGQPDESLSRWSPSFEQMVSKDLDSRNTFAWVFSRLVEENGDSTKPDETTFLSVLKACESLGAVEK
ncbi:Unknown protein [Striga hermonthica]|uniref:Uncharacterized protein n=1 Tax=Striga hermonthica TaxID=68872 RepID=A0A9N7P354_STRHE|nr:Unknown protein [Striga hermonthica]